jgi:adenine-specific DNA methylase
MIRDFIQNTKLTKYTNEPYIIFDIGSQDCTQSIEFYKEFPNSKIYAFVSNSNTLESYKKYTTPYSDRITIIEGLLSDYDGDIRLNSINQQNTIKSLQCHRLDTLMNKYGISKVDLLWINMPYNQKLAEVSVLKGLGKHLHYGIIIRTDVTETTIKELIGGWYLRS